ncbi:MAG: GEVED domain-containing protein [Firmicutes bacterium]|nr:GEVED domain-containing protein [Bacillota bacterium]MCM1401910.1 GEVED domain-containing protein [Bacteroides sp.]MCM1477824.1 GEVED domain-containing protein [Bacteroides sp.]
MKIKQLTYLTSIVLASGVPAQADATVKVTFESNDYKALGVYDTWEASPFRTGALTGNCAVTANPFSNEINNSENVLAVQRSRYGSNTFGARIDLKEPFELTPTTQFVHVMLNTPRQGRVMLVGLGKRTDREEQSSDVEQFWVMSRNDITANEWSDAVFGIKGAGGIEIHSLVVVPYAESSHTLSNDFVAYIDDIELNSSSMPRAGSEDYVLNFDADATNSRYGERNINSVKLDNATIAASDRTYYQSKLDKTFNVKAGQSVRPAIDYKGAGMHGYVYIDRDNDGRFSYDLNGRVPADVSDLVAYSYFNGYNHKGTSSSNQSRTMTNFTIPADMPVGMYRMRFKIDRNCVDPGGNTESDNLITSNAGGIIDVMLNVHADKVSVSQANRNGEVVAADGTKLERYQTNFGEPLKIKMIPENGFEYSGILVRHGYNLDGKQYIHGNPQWREITYTHDLFNADDTFTIPAEVMDGDVLIEGLFIETGNKTK